MGSKLHNSVRYFINFRELFSLLSTYFTQFFHQDWFRERLNLYAEVVHDKAEVLDKCVRFLDEKVIDLARPSDFLWQLATYIGYKEKHALKFQTIYLTDRRVGHILGLKTEKVMTGHCTCAVN